MASILHSLAEILKRNEGRGGALLPSTTGEARRMDAEQAMLASDFLGQQYEEYDLEGGYPSDAIEMENVMTEEELAMQAYSAAKNQTHREDVYESDFYRDLNARIPSEDSGNSIVWRVDVDHPVVVVLTDVLGQNPIHLISDIYGDQLIYGDHDVRSAIQYLLDLCQKYELPVSPTPHIPADTPATVATAPLRAASNGFVEVPLKEGEHVQEPLGGEKTDGNHSITISMNV